MNTKPKLKIGQKYRVIKPLMKLSRDEYIETTIEVTLLYKDGFYDETGYWWNSDDKLQLISGISKSPRQFVLLKDTPELKEGSILTYYKELDQYTTEISQKTINDRVMYVSKGFESKTVESQPIWFRELFEEVKEVKESKEIKGILRVIRNPSGTVKYPTKAEMWCMLEELQDRVNSFNKEK